MYFFLVTFERTTFDKGAHVPPNARFTHTRRVEAIYQLLKAKSVASGGSLVGIQGNILLDADVIKGR